MGHIKSNNKMDKLQIKHITSYLTYGSIDVRVENENGYHLDFIDGISVNPDEMVILSEFGDWYFNTEFNDFNIKLYLRPLSQLTREEYWKLSGKDENNDFWFWVCNNITQGEYIHFEGYSSKNYSKNDYKLIPFNKMEFLLKHKFDIFGLIDKGLAIPY